jgi:hypothetical protein
MLAKKIKYVDYNGDDQERTFLFNLNKAEIAEMEMTTPGGLVNHINKITDAQNLPELTALFKTLILKSYGEKSSDGQRFVKSEELSTEFSETEAYSELFVELISNADAAANFVNGIVPTISNEQIAEAEKKLSPDDPRLVMLKKRS